MTKTFTAFAAALSCVFAIPSSLMAETHFTAPHTISNIQSAEGYDRVVVDFSDLDLRINADQKQLRSRIFKAAVMLCSEDRGAVKNFIEIACRRSIMRSATPQLAKLALRAKSNDIFALRLEIRRAG
jgi:UrcA family protein